jgi:hypothetical protein
MMVDGSGVVGRPMRGGMVRLGILLAAMCAALVVMSVQAVAAAVPVPSADPFYTPPANLAGYAPGTVLRSREVTVDGLTNVASTTAYQLLYRTTDATGQPIATVTTLLLPSRPAAGVRDLLSYQPAEDSLSTKCAPSYTIRNALAGTTQVVENGAITLGLERGWDVVMPDYEGPDSEWTVGPLEGRTTLDSIRAVEQFTPAGLTGAATPVAMVGYSGGSIPTLWANSLAATYAPGLHLVAAASGGNVPDLIENLSAVNGGPFAGAIFGALVGVSRAYPQLDLNALLNAKGRALAATDGVDGDDCAGSVINAPFGTVSEYTTYPTVQAAEAASNVQQVFAKLDLIGGPIPQAPAFVYQEIHDELAITPPVDQMVASDCARGAIIDYDRAPIGEHVIGAGTFILPAFDYLADRFAGKPAPDNCPSQPASTATPTTGASSTSCPAATGRLDELAIGPVRLGMTRAQAQRALPRITGRGGRDIEDFCLTGNGIRAGYPSPALLRTLPVSEQRQLTHTVVLVLTANPRYELRGVPVGARLTTITRHLRVTAPLHIGINDWYLTPNGQSTGVLEVRHGIIEEIGIASKDLTNTRRNARRFLAIFS